MDFRIGAIHAFVAVDSRDGDEGVVGIHIPGQGLVPAITADDIRLEELRPLVQEIANRVPEEIKLVRFDQRTDVETIERKAP